MHDLLQGSYATVLKRNFQILDLKNWFSHFYFKIGLILTIKNKFYLEENGF